MTCKTHADLAPSPTWPTPNPEDVSRKIMRDTMRHAARLVRARAWAACEAGHHEGTVAALHGAATALESAPLPGEEE